MRLLLLVAMLVPLTARAETALPTPLRVALAHDRRSEVLASRARIRAAAERPALVSALDEPLVSASSDHPPFALAPISELDPTVSDAAPPSPEEMEQASAKQRPELRWRP